MAAASPVLTTAIGTYPYTQPLKDGSITSPRITLDHKDVVPANRAFRPMVNQLAFDVSELALVTLLLAKACNRPLVGVPVILMQQSAYNMLLVRQDSPLRDAHQLQGRTIGVRAYTQTTGTWLRGMLHDQFHVDLDTLEWVTFEPAHVEGFVDPPNARRAEAGKTLAGMLRSGQLDAAAGLEPADHPDLRTLFDSPLEVEADWVRQTGVQPINHTMVVRCDVVEHYPWVLDELAQLVAASKRYADAEAPPDGLESNRKALALLARYTFEQHITPRMFEPEELFSTE
jgi:4,5-dihydroxyphthalate decarboxylase